MKGFKKGVALIAVLAFLITAILPAAAFAAPAAGESRTEWRSNNDSTTTITIGEGFRFQATGVSGLPSPEGDEYSLRSTEDNQPTLPKGSYDIDITQGGSVLTIEVYPGWLNEEGTYTYALDWTDPKNGYTDQGISGFTVIVEAPVAGTVSWNGPAGVTAANQDGTDVPQSGTLPAGTTSVTVSDVPNDYEVTVNSPAGATPVKNADGTWTITLPANYNPAVDPGLQFNVKKVDKDALDAAIQAAQKALDGTPESTDGSDVPAGENWATKDQKDKLDDAIKAAQAVLTNPDATQSQIDTAAKALQDAIDAFTDAIKNQIGTQGQPASITLSTSTPGAQLTGPPYIVSVPTDMQTVITPSITGGTWSPTYDNAFTQRNGILTINAANLPAEGMTLSYTVGEGSNEKQVTLRVEGPGTSAPSNAVTLLPNRLALLVGQSGTITAVQNGIQVSDGSWTVTGSAIAEGSPLTSNPFTVNAVSKGTGTVTYTVGTGANVKTATANVKVYDLLEVAESASMTAPGTLQGPVTDPVTGSVTYNVDLGYASDLPSRRLELPKVDGDGVSYSWTCQQVQLQSDGDGELSSKSLSDSTNNSVTIDEVGQFVYTCTLTNEADPTKTSTVTFNVIVRGEIASIVPNEYHVASAGVNLLPTGSSITISNPVSAAAAGNRDVSKWAVPNPSVGTTHGVQYLWRVSGQTAGLDVRLTGSGLTDLGSGYYLGGYNTTGVTVNGLETTDNQVTISVRAVVPGTVTKGSPLPVGRSGAPEPIYLSDWTDTTVRYAGSRLNGLSPDAMLEGWIGEALDESATVTWWPVNPLDDTVDHWIMQPLDQDANGNPTGTIGQEIIVTPGTYDPNQLTFTTNGPLVGVESGVYLYNLIAYSDNPGTPGNQVDGTITVALHVHLRKPALHDQSAQMSPGVDSIWLYDYVNNAWGTPSGTQKGNVVLATWTEDARGNIQPQRNNLPSFQVLATMEGGDKDGWVQTQWAISDKAPSEFSANGVVSIADFDNPDLMTKVSAGASQTGDLYATYAVQPDEVLNAVRLNQAKGTLGVSPWSAGTPLYYYAKVQYGSNPNCAVVTSAPFQLYLVRDGDQYFFPLNADGQIADLAFPPLQAPGTPNPDLWHTAEITAVTGSKAPTQLNTLWIPNQAPSGVSYDWTFESGPAAVTIGGASVSPSTTAVIKGANSQNLAVSNFTVSGRYRFVCTPKGTGITAKPVRFEVNVGQIAVASRTDQAQYYGAWIEPAKGLFADSKDAPRFSTSDYPTAPTPVAVAAGKDTYPLGTLGSMLTIGNVSGLTVTGPSWIDGATVPVSLNSRFQLYFDPSGIQYGTTENGEPNWLSADPTSDNYWKNFVVLEWRYKTSQYMEDDGNSGNIPRGMGFSGVNSPMLTSGPITAAMDGWQFALEIHDKNDENVYTTTRWVLLDIDGMNPATQPEATISSYPASNGSVVSLTAGSDVTFTASAQGSIPAEDLTYQWQSRPAVSEAAPDPQWADITGADESTYSLSNVALDMNGTEYRCIVTNTAYAGGVKAISGSLKMNVTAANGSVVVETPTAATLVNYYASRQLETSVTARTDNGDPVTYEWFVKSFVGPVPTGDAAADTIDEAAALIAASGSKPVTSMEGASVSGSSMTSAPLSEGVYQFTCRVVNANDASKSLNSPPVYVVVTESSRKPYISVPSAPDSGVCSVGVTNGQSIRLDCKAWIASDPGDGEDISYQWQTSSSVDGPWNDLEATTSTLTISTVTPTYTGAYFRCVATNAKANESTASVPYRLNVWNVAEVPTIQSGPDSQEIQWNGSVPGNEISITSVATVPQGSDHNTMRPVWWFPGDGSATLDTNPTPNVSMNYPSWWDESWKKPMVSLDRTVANGVVTYTSTLSIPVEPGDVDQARALSGAYAVTWFNNQEINEDTGYNVEVNEKYPCDTTYLVAPQATSDTATVQILISGTPRIPVHSELTVTKAIGETASFSITALLNENQNENPRGELVYVWQVSKDGGATWNNALSTDGTGQFTDTFTTIPLTQTMYDNSTASNVPGPGTGGGTVGNAKTVYEYRCIVANRTTGMKAVSDDFMLIITAVSGPVQEPTLESAGNITIEGTAPNRYATGVTVSLTGTTVDKFFEDYGWKAPAGYSLQIVGADGEVLEGSDLVYTGCVLQLVKDSTGEVVDSATIIVRGDVLGDTNTATVGTLAVNQLVRMAQDLNETRPLDGIFEMAGDFNGNGSIDIADLVAEAQLLSLDEPVQK